MRDRATINGFALQTNLSAVDNFQAGGHRMTDYEKRHRYRVKHVVAANQQTNQHKHHNRTDIKIAVFFQVSQVPDRFQVEIFTLVDQG